jgi:hypothetical protein
MAQHAEIEAEVEEQLCGDVARALAEGLADIGVFVEGTPIDGLTVRRSRPTSVGEAQQVAHKHLGLRDHRAVAGGHFKHLPAGQLAHALAHRVDGRVGRLVAVDEQARQLRE